MGSTPRSIAQLYVALCFGLLLSELRFQLALLNLTESLFELSGGERTSVPFESKSINDNRFIRVINRYEDLNNFRF